jgi:hypothetical protein
LSAIETPKPAAAFLSQAWVFLQRKMKKHYTAHSANAAPVGISKAAAVRSMAMMVLGLRLEIRQTAHAPVVTISNLLSSRNANNPPTVRKSGSWDARVMLLAWAVQSAPP